MSNPLQPTASSSGPTAGAGSGTLPKFDNTLGALFIGSNIATALYGVVCLQMFIYITSIRTQRDPRWLRLLVTFVFLGDTVHQAMIVATLYRFLVSDYLNPAALPSGGAGSGEVFSYAQSIAGAITILAIQLFFSWRIWAFSGSALNQTIRFIVSVTTVILAFFSFGSSVDLAITGFNHRLLEVNTPEFTLAYKLSVSSRIAFDVFVATAMTFTLQRSRSGVKRTDHVITLLILFTVNTNLITTLFSISELVTFLALPHATIYGGLGFISPKTYLNTFFAVLNSRAYMGGQLDNNNVVSGTELSSIQAARYRSGTRTTPSSSWSSNVLGILKSKNTNPTVTRSSTGIESRILQQSQAPSDAADYELSLFQNNAGAKGWQG